MMPRPASSPQLRRRRLWLRALIVVILLSPLLVFLLSNAWLQTSWGKNWVAQKISQRIGIPVQISGTGWLPGGQVWIDNLQVLAPSSSPQDSPSTLLHVRCVSIRPAWSAWLRGSRKISDIHLTAPRINIPLETLRNFVPTPSATPPSTPPTVAANTQAPAPAPATANPTTPATPTIPPAPAPSPIAEPPSPTVWLKITDGFFSVTHPAQSQPLLEINSISADLPIAGAPATGHLHTSSLLALGQTLASQGHINLRWQFPLWESETTKLSFAGIHADAKFQIGRVAGLPFSLMVAQEPQNWQDAEGQNEINHFQSLHRLTGFMIAPQTWQGESVWQTEEINASLGNRQFQFFAAHARLLFQGGTLHCPDLRLVGDDYSILGNGKLTVRGECLGLTRLIAPRATADSWEQRWRQAFPDLTVSMPPMFNEDRRAIDILCGGTPSQPWLSFDQGKTLLDLRKILQRWQQTHQVTQLPPTP